MKWKDISRGLDPKVENLSRRVCTSPASIYWPNSSQAQWSSATKQTLPESRVHLPLHIKRTRSGMPTGRDRGQVRLGSRVGLLAHRYVWSLQRCLLPALLPFHWVRWPFTLLGYEGYHRALPAENYGSKFFHLPDLKALY